MYLDEPIVIVALLISFFNAILGLLVISKTEEAETGWFFWFIWLVLIVVSIFSTPYFFDRAITVGHSVMITIIPFFMSYGLITIALFFYHLYSADYRRNLIGYMISLCLFIISVFFGIEHIINLIPIGLVLFFMIFELVLAIKILWLHSKIKEERNKQKVTSNKTSTKRRVSPVQGNAKRPIRSVRAKRPPTRPK